MVRTFANVWNVGIDTSDCGRAWRGGERAGVEVRKGSIEAVVMV